MFGENVNDLTMTSPPYSGYWYTYTGKLFRLSSYARSESIIFGMGDCISMLISGYSLSNETLNRDPLALLLRRQYEFPSGIKKVQF